MPSQSHVRLCHVVKQPDEQFEFNLKQDEARKGQLISVVTPNGPGDRAGLKKGDRIITINGVSAENKTHSEVVRLIKESMPKHEIKFEVIDEDHDPNKLVATETRTNGKVAPNPSDLRPRICKIVKRRGTLGFHLEAQGSEGKPGHFIKEVTDGGPAVESGLKKGDRIIEVGGTNVEKMNHTKVVSQIKKNGNKVTLLVVDEATYKHFAARKMKIKAKRAYSTSDVVSDQSTTSLSGSIKSNEGSKKSQIKSTSSESVSQKTSDDEKARLVHVVKESGKGYGFFLRVKKGEKGDYLGELETGKAGDRCGLMNEDRVVAVNGNFTLLKPHDEVVALIKSIPNHVVFLVAGPKAIEHAKTHGLVATLSGATEHLLEKPRTVKLHKGKDGYGFFLKMDGGSSKHIISNVESGSIASREGLEDGDILACVGDSSVMHLSHEESVQKIKAAGDSVELTVGTSKTMSVLYDLGISVSPKLLDSWPEEEMFRIPDVTEHNGFFGAVLAAVVKEAANEATERETRVCKLRKIDGGFGFFLRDDFAHLLSNVEKGGAADVAGVQEDDQIIEVNGTNVEKMQHDDVVALIRQSGEEVTFLVCDFGKRSLPNAKADSAEPTVRPDDAKTSTTEDERNRPLPRFCELAKENNTFGFHLNGEGGDRPGQFVRQIADGGPGEKAGLREGDRVIETNGENIENKTHDDVVAMIKASGDKVNFLVVDEETDLYYKQRSISITKALLVGIIVTEAKENLDSRSNASSVIEAEATVHVGSDDQESCSPVMEFPPPPPLEEDVTDLIEDAINEVREQEIQEEAEERLEEVVDAIEETKDELRDEVASEVRDNLEEELTELAEEIREQANEQDNDDIREELRDAATAIAVVAAVEEVRDEMMDEREEAREEMMEDVKEEIREEMREEAQEQAREEFAEELQEEVIEEVREEIVEEIKEDVEERLRKEMRERIEDEMREKMEEEMRRKQEEEEKARKLEEEMREQMEEEMRRKQEEEEMARKLEEEMREKIEEELRRKQEEEELKRQKEEELKRKIEDEMREKIAEELRQKSAEEFPPPPEPAKFVPSVMAASASNREVKLRQSVKKTPADQMRKTEDLAKAVQNLRKVRRAEEVVSSMKEAKREEEEDKPYKPNFMSARAMFESGNMKQQPFAKTTRLSSSSSDALVKQEAIPNGNAKPQPARQSSSSGKGFPFKIIETSAAFR